MLWHLALNTAMSGSKRTEEKLKYLGVERSTPEPVDLLDLIRRARSGDEAASTDLARRIGPFIERVVRLRMGRRGSCGPLEPDFASSDVCQSVFRSLFRGLRENRYELNQPDDLERLLRVMIRFNVATKARRSGVKLRKLIGDFEQAGWLDPAPSPDENVADRYLIGVIQEQFSEAELEVFTLWLDETPWAAIGQKLGCSGDAARVRLMRAVARVRKKIVTEDQRQN
jgi:DNA-directed RNA polymerase specialized sigma24 family protein